MTTATRQPLDRALRRALESTVIKARDVAEEAATQALKRLGVPDAKPAEYLDDAQRDARRRQEQTSGVRHSFHGRVNAQWE